MIVNRRFPFRSFKHGLLAALVLVSACVETHVQKAANFAVVEDKDVMVPTRHGVKLAMDVYRPARDGKVVESRLFRQTC